ncbi:MAG: TolC family protein [Lacibacter sp.]|jgi:outer membrane protein TolC
MYKSFLLIIGIVSCFITCHAQQAITLQDLIQKAEQNYPATSQKEYVKALGNQNERIFDMSLYPQVNVTGQATYQSEVSKFNIPGSGFPILPKDNYNIGIDLRFPLTEFAVVKTKKQLEQARTNLGINQLDVELQRIRERVTNVFGNILLQQENKRILLIRIADLEAQRKKVAVGVTNGAILKSNQLVFESEILTAEQRISDIDAAVLSLTQELSILTGSVINPDNIFQLPATDTLQKAINRPEFLAFQSQKDILSLQKEVLKKENKPKLFVFSQGFYGRPGYNFLNTDLRLYGLAGVGISWNINNTVIQKSREKTIEINKQIVDRQKETFNLNLQTALTQKETEINKYETIISKDREIVIKRKEIMKSVASQLENGAITSTEYLTELNAQNSAELNLVLHKVQQAIAKTQYNILTGN